MSPSRTPDPILTQWTAALHYAIEAGAAPHLLLGFSSSPLPALVGLDALRRLVDRRNDRTTPVVAAGGPAGAWLSALTLPQNGTPLHAPAMVVLYTGVDPACHAASGATLPLHPAGFQPPGNRRLPPGLVEAVAPAAQPALPFSWEALPLHALEPPPATVGSPGATVGSPGATVGSPGATVGVPTAGRWAGWSALALVALLILGAILL